MPKVESIYLKEFKRFTELNIGSLPESARMVVLIGPNGCGKTSLFEAFNVSDQMRLTPHTNLATHSKNGLCSVTVKMHPTEAAGRPLFYFRSAHRHEQGISISRQPSDLPPPGVERTPSLNYADGRVSSNCSRIMIKGIEELWGEDQPLKTQPQMRDAIWNKVRPPLNKIFADLTLDGFVGVPGQPTLRFSKGAAQQYDFSNLSGGEKAVFDLLLDFVMKTDQFKDIIVCIDEPELHMHTQLQSLLLAELYQLIPRESQLWISTHSIGMLRTALRLHAAHPDEVIFLDFEGLDFDKPQTMTPARADRNLWQKTLRTALHDLADLVSPEEIIICEGYPPSTGKPKNAEFDARAYRAIFSASHPKTEFVSAGSSNDIVEDSIKLATALGVLVPGVKIVRLIDRDNKSQNEVDQFRANGIKVLSRYSIENYLWSDEILTKLMRGKHCSTSDEEKILASKAGLVGRVPGAPEYPMENIKDQGGLLYAECRKIPKLRGLGSTTYEFALQELAPLVTEDTDTYKVLEHDVFS